MEFLKEKSKVESIQSKYQVVVTTMTGDGNDYHKFSVLFDKNQISDLQQYIVYCEVLQKQYPNGRGGCDDYEFDFFEECFSDNWYIYDGMEDSMEDYSVYYYDEDGIKYDIKVVLSKEDIKVIDSFGILK
jgi:hypothetical protein